MWVTHLSPFPNSEILKSGDHTSFTWHMAYISYTLTSEEKRKKRESGREGKRQGGRKEKRKERREAGRNNVYLEKAGEIFKAHTTEQ